MTPNHTTPTKSHTNPNPFVAVTAFIGWVAAADRRFRRTQSMIEGHGIHF